MGARGVELGQAKYVTPQLSDIRSAQANTDRTQPAAARPHQASANEAHMHHK